RHAGRGRNRVHSRSSRVGEKFRAPHSRHRFDGVRGTGASRPDHSGRIRRTPLQARFVRCTDRCDIESGPQWTHLTPLRFVTDSPFAGCRANHSDNAAESYPEGTSGADPFPTTKADWLNSHACPETKIRPECAKSLY